MVTILVVEDDVNLNKGISFVLKKEGYTVFSAHTKAAGKKIILEQSVDFLLLDINLPDGTGLELCQEIVDQITFPIVFLTANDSEEDMIKGFESGADDYLTKPFSLKVLKHKIKAILKNQPVFHKHEFIYEGLQVNYDKQEVFINDQSVSLTATEFRLLEMLTQHQGQVMTKEVLLEKLWDVKGNFVDENTLSVTIRRLRKKIETNVKEPQYIMTVFGVGYRFGG